MPTNPRKKTLARPPRRPSPRPRTGKQTKDSHPQDYHAKLKRAAVKQGKCRQCFQKRDKKSPSAVRCTACYRRHREQMKKYRHDKVSQAVVKTRPTRETAKAPKRPSRRPAAKRPPAKVLTLPPVAKSAPAPAEGVA